MIVIAPPSWHRTDVRSLSQCARDRQGRFRQKSLDTAAALTTTAETAQQAASASAFDPTADYTATGLEGQVSVDRDLVGYAQSALDTELQAQQDAKSGGYDDGSHDVTIAIDRSDLASAQAKLRQDQQGLARARSQADTTKSAQTSKAKDAAYLLAKADAANSKALSLVGQATDVDKTPHDSLAQAKETKTSHQASNDAALASWTHRHRVRIDDVRALRAVTNSCRAAGVRDAEIAAGLTATALLLGLAPAVTGRRRLHPRNSL